VLPSVNYLVQVSALTHNLNFVVGAVEAGSVLYNLTSGYTLSNKALADFMVNGTVQAMMGEPVLGNGFEVPTRTHPNINLDSKYLMIYDSSNQPKLKSTF
jgi:hypothetical protein